MAPARVEVEGGTEIKFAQKLAGNEKEGRDKALRKLKKWIQLRSSPESSESGEKTSVECDASDVMVEITVMV